MMENNDIDNDDAVALMYVCWIDFLVVDDVVGF